MGCKRENHASQEGAEQHAAAATFTGDARGRVAAPVRQAHPKHPGQIREDAGIAISTPQTAKLTACN